MVFLPGRASIHFVLVVMISPEYKPLSPLQMGMLSDHVRDFRPGIDIMQALCATTEALVPDTFWQAWKEVVERHEVLRSRFLWEEVEQPVREVRDTVTMPFAEHDWRGVSRKEQESRFRTFLAEDRKKGLDLDKAPLMRVTLFRLGKKEWRWCWTCHHLLLDARGLLLVLDEVFAIYDARRSGVQAVLSAAPLFDDYVTWHARQDWPDAEKWWRPHLAGFSQPTPLIPDHEPDRAAQDSCAEYRSEVPARITRKLNALASKAGVTLNTVLQGAWAIFLSRYSGEEDVVFGAVRACRKSNVSSAPATVGLFVNTLPVRVRVRSEDDLIPWLREVRKQWTALRDFENVPLTHVQEWSDVPRGSRLFESIFNYQEPSWDKALTNRGRAWRHRRFSLRCQPSYPLTMDIYGGGACLGLNMVYDHQRFSVDTIARMMHAMQTLLESMASSAARHLGDLEVLPRPVHQLVVQKWNDTARRYPRKGIHDLFEHQVKRTPDAVALAFAGESISYHKLNLRANRLGRYLQSLGAGPGVMVAICIERSLDLIVGLLGILKSGAAYVPLDPEYPEERLTFMLRDSGASLLVTHGHLVQRLPATSARLILLDTGWPEIKRQSSDGFPSGAQADSPAYVIYTSGSTGTPKGVVVPHRAVVRLVVNTDYVSLSPADVLLQIAPVSFDASTFEIWGALLNGARIEVHPPGRYALEDLADFISTRGVTTMFVTTALFQQLVELHADAFRGVRQLLTGGETMPVETMRKALRDLPGTRIIHCYGPTENTTFTTCLQVTEVPSGATSIPIGRPIANTTVYVLDARLRPVPPGVPGELYTGGDGLALGYLNRPELTAERFVPHPLGRRKGDRLYRTGDLARWLPGGTIDFIGRVDHQVKIRGHRIELGEIESVLSSYPEVSAAVVLVREDSPGNKRLAAFVSLHRKVPVREVRLFLEGRLPAYMIPSVFVFLESLPLNANGKVDRQALSSLIHLGEAGVSGEGPERQHVAPRNEMEEIVAAIWADALELPMVGAHDHFFELGGHSLRAMAVVSKLRKAVGKSVPVRLLFESPVLESFCEALQQFRFDADSETAQTITKMPRRDPLPASVYQERIWRSRLQRPKDTLNNGYLYIQLKGLLDVSALERSLSEIIRRHELLRTRVELRESGPVQIIADPKPLSMEVVPMTGRLRKSDALRDQLHHIAQADLEQGSGPMVRFALLRWNPASHLFVMALHPLVYESSVRRILFRELGLLYAAYREGRHPHLPEPKLQYADFAMWQQRWLKKDLPARRKLIEFWSRTLGGDLRPVTLPFVRRSSEPSPQAADPYFLVLERAAVARVTLLSKKEGATQFMFLLACIKVLLHMRTQQTDILVGTYFAGEGHPELEEVMGPRTNLVPLRSDLSGNPSFVEVLRRVREVVLEAQAHQELPFEQLCAALAASGRSVPVIEAIIMHTHAERPYFNLPGIHSRPLKMHSRSSSWGFALNFLTRGSSKFLDGYCFYDGNRYDEAAVQKFVNGLPRLVDKVTTNPSMRLNELASAE